MAEAYELAASREIKDGENPSADTVWQVRDAHGYIDARGTLDSVLPTSFTFPSGRVAFLDSIEADELLDDEFWQFSIGYRAQPEPSIDEVEFEFDIPALNERVFQSITTAKYAPPNKQAPDFGGACGVAFGNRQPAGVDPYEPKSTFSLTKHWALSAVTLGFQAALEVLVGSVNSSTFYGRAPGTVRFLGARGRRNGDKFPISYDFGFRPSSSAYQAGTIQVPQAYGWDVHDVYYAPEPDTNAKQAVWKPRAVFIHRIHPLANLNTLNV